MEERQRVVGMRKHRRVPKCVTRCPQPRPLELRPLVALVALALEEALGLMLPHAPEAEKLKG